jgi:hypothetical protein
VFPRHRAPLTPPARPRRHRPHHPRATLAASIGAAGLAAALALTVSGAPAQASATPRQPAATTAKATSLGVLPIANGTWAYDGSAAGTWSPVISAYNNIATAGHKLTELFSYATDMEMYCPSNNPAECTPADLQSYYTAKSSGFASTLAYYSDLTLAPGIASGSTAEKISLSPIIDGRTDTGGYLIGFDQLSQSLAQTYADQVAAQVCADPRVDGIQFDIEPFDVSTKNGQYYFYMQIAKDFAGEHTGSTTTDPYACVGAGHPQGRYFSVFTFAASIQPGTTSATDVAAFTSAYHNGYVIDSLYDLGSNPAGSLNDLPTYQTLVTQEADNMKTWAHSQSIPYAFGIPAAASAHEYTTCTGTCVVGANGTTGNPMLSYAQEAVAAINGSGATSDGFFLGTDIWDLGGSTSTGGANLTPDPANADVLNYLATNLPG